MNSRLGRGTARYAWVALFALQGACGPSPEANTPATAPATRETSRPVAVTAPATTIAPMPELPSGELAPVEIAETVAATLLEADESDGFQTFLLEVADQTEGDPPTDPWVVRVEGAGLGGAPAVFAGAEDDALTASPRRGVRLWVRRPMPSAAPSDKISSPSELRMQVYTSAQLHPFLGTEQGDVRSPSGPRIPGRHFPVLAPLPSKLSAKPKILTAYLAALGRARPRSPVSWFLAPEARTPNANSEAQQVSQEWSQLMRFTTGYDSVEAALVTEERLRVPVSPAAARVAFASLRGPELRRHDWTSISKALSGVTPGEPLAAMVPAEFYYVRATSFEAFQTLTERIDEVVTPGLRVLEQHREHLNLSERYRLELGVPADDLARVFGPHLVSSLAVVGSDPMLRQGSDVSLVLDVPHPDALSNVLDVKRAAVSETLPLTASQWAHRGIPVSSYHSADHRVRQELVFFKRGDGKTFVLISNSPGAVKRIIDTWLGEHPALAAELDFQYMLRRDATVPEDVLVYMGDRFVAEAVSPRQRILDSRRQIAKAELAAMGYGSLLFGELYGRLPKDAKELSRQSWFGVKRTKHTSGETIRHDQQSGPSSAWGTPARLTSIIDLPIPARISAAEATAYREFASRYESNWGERIDPIAVRVKVSSKALDAHLRVLPLVNNGDYEDVLRWSGGGSTQRSASLAGVAGILAIGEGSPLREFLTGNGRSFLGDKFKLDWLGNWAEVGLADEPRLAELVRLYGELPTPTGEATPTQNEAEMVARVPAYLAIDIESAAGAAVMLTVLRELATGASPDTVTWGEHSKHKGSTIVAVNIEEVTVFYALTKRRLLVALQLDVLQRLIEAMQSEDSQVNPPAGAPAASGGQLVVDVAPKSQPGVSLLAQSALRTVATWILEKGVVESGVDNPLAELLLLGVFSNDPAARDYETQALRWLGSVPVTADGKLYHHSPSGVSDPDRGNRHAPKWPKVPLASSPAGQLLSSVLGLRTEVSVDAEPASSERSLRATARLRFE